MAVLKDLNLGSMIPMHPFPWENLLQSLWRCNLEIKIQNGGKSNIYGRQHSQPSAQSHPTASPSSPVLLEELVAIHSSTPGTGVIPQCLCDGNYVTAFLRHSVFQLLLLLITHAVCRWASALPLISLPTLAYCSWLVSSQPDLIPFPLQT